MSFFLFSCRPPAPPYRSFFCFRVPIELHKNGVHVFGEEILEFVWGKNALVPKLDPSFFPVFMPLCFPVLVVPPFPWCIAVGAFRASLGGYPRQHLCRRCPPQCRRGWCCPRRLRQNPAPLRSRSRSRSRRGGVTRSIRLFYFSADVVGIASAPVPCAVWDGASAAATSASGIVRDNAAT